MRMAGPPARGSHIAALVSLLASAAVAEAQAPPSQAVIAWHVTVPPAWFDPAAAPPQVAAFGMLYAIHDAVVRSLPGQRIGKSLASGWTESADGRVYTFT